MPDGSAFAGRVEADAAAIGNFADALFRYADPGTYASLRAFRDDVTEVFRISPHEIGDSLDSLTAAAGRLATLAANHAAFPVVFAPPVATFTNASGAKEEDLANGLALSVECDATPIAARERLEALIGPATVIVASGGEWTNPTTGEIEPKLHLHWRLTEPTREASDHARLKLARTLATALVGGDASNKPIVHPIRWPGSWHRKRAPRLARIEALHADREIDLADALQRLKDAADAAGVGSTAKAAGDGSTGTGEARDTAELVRAILTAEDYHAPLATLAMRFLKAGTADAQAVVLLRGIMLAIPEAQRDMKDGQPQPGRWQARFDDIPRAVSTARAKIGERSNATPEQPGGAWPDPLDFLADADMTGVPELRAEHLPDALAGFAFDTAGRMGVDPAAVALTGLVALASVMHDDWRLQPKARDEDWTEQPRIWGAIVGDPSILKTPVLKATTKPIDRLDAEARDRHAAAMRAWKEQVAALKAEKVPPEGWPAQPRLDRYVVEGTTVEALSEALRDDAEARQRAPADKVLVRQDEMSEWLASFDRYRSGGRGGGDRGAYVRLYNGGVHNVDRIGRGSFAIPNWSACVVGGIQPGPIQQVARDAADDGLLQRFCYCVPGRQNRGEDREPDAQARERYAALFKALTVLHPPKYLSGEPHVVKLHAEAHQWRERMNDLVEAMSALPDTSTRLKSAFGKWFGLFARLTLVFHLVDIADAHAQGRQAPPMMIVTPETAGKVASYMRDILLPHLLRAEAVMFASNQTGHARWIAGFILSRGEERITVRDIVRAYGALRAPEHRRELNSVMESLEAVGWLRAEPQDVPGKPPVAWAVNPTIHKVFAARAAIEREARQAAKQKAIEAMQRFRQEARR